MFLLRASLYLILSIVVISCTPQFQERFYSNPTEIKNVIALSVLMKDEQITQLIYLSEHLIIVNGVIINTAMKTYGEPPEGGFFRAYAENASSYVYTDWNDLVGLVSSSHIPSKSKLDHMFKLLAASGFSEYHYDKEYDVHAFQSGSNVLKGFYGVLVGSRNSSEHISIRENYDYFNEIKDGVYYFEFR